MSGSALRNPVPLVLLISLLALGACGEQPHGEAAERGGGGPGAAPAGGFPGAAGAPQAAVPVEVAPVERRTISSFIETNGTLEAENEVDLVARVSAPVERLLAEEADAVRSGQLLAELDDREIAARAEVSRVALEEARLALGRAEELRASQLISPESYDQATTRFETARAQYESDQIQLGYTEIRAPFAGLVVTRYVDLAQQVAVGSPLFRLSDFTPLLCPIQVPERELSRLSKGQMAYLEVEAFPGERFEARVLRLSPVVEAATGTIRVTLEVDGRARLRPGMFARVFLEAESREGALVIPKTALLLESIGDTVYVDSGGFASRREVELGFREGDFVEVLSGLEEGEPVVVVGQDGLSEGTPVQVLGASGAFAEEGAAGSPGRPAAAAAQGGAGMGSGGPMGFDPSRMTPEQLEQVKERMRQRGLSEEEIGERLERMGAGGRTEGGRGGG